jgi:lipid A 3-O-deacylase
MMKKRIVVTLVLCAAISMQSHAVDGISVEAGRGNGADMGHIGVQWDWKQRWFQGQHWHVGGYWDLSLGYWEHGRALPGQNDSIVDIGLTPVFRLQQNDLRGVYAEAAIGFHLLSRTSLGSRRFGSKFQFGDHLGLGYRFGAKGQYDLSYRYQHLSNAGIKKPNDGINFSQIRFQYHF